MPGIFEKVANGFGLATKSQYESLKAKSSSRAFEAARLSRLVSGWISTPVHIDQDLRNDLKILRTRARDLCINNPYGVNFVKLMRRNVFGSNGLSLQMKVRDLNGELDEMANENIEAGFLDWGKKGNCTADRRLSWRGIQNLCASSFVSDGEIILRKLAGFGNRHRFSLQFIDPELLDVNLNIPRMKGRNEVRMGVELDEYDAPVAYHFLQFREVSIATSGFYPTGGDYLRVPASEILHIYPMYRVGQTRGWPLMVPVMMVQKQLAAYEEAEITAARVSACKIGFLTTPTGDEFTGEENSDGTMNMDLEPGEIKELPEGQEFQGWDPQHPNSAFPNFVKAMKQSMATGAGISYPTFTGDLEGVNFSSIRAGLMEDREEWKTHQTQFIEDLAEPTFAAWLETALMVKTVRLPFSKYEKFNKPQFMGRRWPWVDPLKDAEANRVLIEQRLTSRTAVVADQGRDFEDVLEETKQEEALAKSMVVKLPDFAGEAGKKFFGNQGAEEGKEDGDQNNKD